jgi:hypothetical protein
MSGRDQQRAHLGGKRACAPPANWDWQIIVTRVLQGERDLGRVFDERDDSSWPLGVSCPAIYRLFIVRVGGGYDFVRTASG